MSPELVDIPEPTSPTAPLAAFPPLPAENKSRAPEFYGFVAWTSTYLLFIIFVLWAFLPDSVIIWLGITFYPNRYVFTVTPIGGMF
jgi:phosphatidylinositol glycan class P protein